MNFVRAKIYNGRVRGINYYDTKQIQTTTKKHKHCFNHKQYTIIIVYGFWAGRQIYSTVSYGCNLILSNFTVHR